VTLVDSIKRFKLQEPETSRKRLAWTIDPYLGIARGRGKLVFEWSADEPTVMKRLVVYGDLHRFEITRLFFGERQFLYGAVPALIWNDMIFDDSLASLSVPVVSKGMTVTVEARNLSSARATLQVIGRARKAQLSDYPLRLVKNE
jgi:hypothetical protein